MINNRTYFFKILVLTIRIIATYLMLLFIFKFYVGLLDPNGLLYSSFLSKFSLVKGLIFTIISSVRFILESLNFATRQTEYSVGIQNGPGVIIKFACLGFRVILAYSALLLSIKGNNKLFFWLIGVIGILLFNIIRVFSIVYFNNGSIKIVSLTHDAFNFLCYILISLLFYIWSKKYSQLNLIK